MRAKTERERLEQVLLGQAELLQEVYDFLEDAQRHDDVLRAAVRSSRAIAPIELPLADPDRIFSLRSIEALCVKHRLRFLEGGLYKGSIPGPAVLAIRRLEERVGRPITSYMVMAPSAQFKLCDSEVDPLLFVPLGDGCFYLVAKWGNDLAPWRSFLYWPVRTPRNLAITVLCIAVLVSALIPASLLGDAGGWLISSKRLLFLFWSTMVLSGFTLFGWFAFFGQFSKEAWNSRYFN